MYSTVHMHRNSSSDSTVQRTVHVHTAPPSWQLYVTPVLDVQPRAVVFCMHKSFVQFIVSALFSKVCVCACVCVSPAAKKIRLIITDFRMSGSNYQLDEDGVCARVD